jgi:hypothetical protein
LLRGRSTGIAFLVVAVLPRSRSLLLAHTGIVPPEVRIWKTEFRVVNGTFRSTDGGS